MIGFVLNPPRRVKRRRLAHRKLRKNTRRKISKTAMAWKKAVKKYGVMGAAKRRGKRRAAARKAKRTRLMRKNPSKRKVVKKMARRRKTRRRKMRRNVAVANPPRRRRRKMRRNAWKGRKAAHARAARKGWRRRKTRKASRRRSMRRNPIRRRRTRRYRRNSWAGQPIRHKRAARKAWRKHRRKMLPAVRRNIRRALNKKHGVRRWVKHSRAKWNPGVSLSVGGIGRSITDVFKLENVYDGLAIGGGIMGALAFPKMLDRVIPASITGRLPFGMSLSTGWFSYVAMAGSSGLLGYLAGAAFGRRYGEKVFWGGIGVTLAKVILDYVGPVRSFLGVGLGAYNPKLQRVIEQEVANELRAGGKMSGYVSPQDLANARSLGDYASPASMLRSQSLGAADEFGSGSEEF